MVHVPETLVTCIEPAGPRGPLRRPVREAFWGLKYPTTTWFGRVWEVEKLPRTAPAQSFWTGPEPQPKLATEGVDRGGLHTCVLPYGQVSL
jgi:hypothetical protein